MGMFSYSFLTQELKQITNIFLFLSHAFFAHSHT